MKKTIIVTIVLVSLLIPRMSVFASTQADIEIEILKIRIKILELQIQYIMVAIQEIQSKKEAVVEDKPIIAPEPKTSLPEISPSQYPCLRGRCPSQP